MMHTGSIVAMGAACLVATAAAAQAPSMQQAFDAAAALDAKGDYAGSFAAWAAMEARAKPGSRTRGIALVRKSNALIKLKRPDDAVQAARAGLAIMPKSDPSLAEDRWRAYFQIGAVASSAIDYASADEAFLAAEATAPNPAMRMAALLAFVESAVFVDPAAAEAALGRIDAMAAGQSFDKESKAMIARRHALLLLNRGDFAGARIHANEAVKQLGGLTSKTDTRDVSARSDAAIAALLAGKTDDARRYMAMTGAGRINKGSFDPAVQMTIPDCGGEAGLKPGDMAIIEFSIAEDGIVYGVAPIYAAGGGAVAMEFARAARDWSWTPEQVKMLPAFFRANARVELRCSTSFQRPSVGRLIGGETRAWLESKGFAVPPENRGGDAAAIGPHRAALVAVEAKAGPSALAVLPALFAVMDSSVVGREEVHGLASRAIEIARANAAPPMVMLYFDMASRVSSSADTAHGGYRRLLTPLLSDPVYAAAPSARAALRLLLADSEEKITSERARVLLQEVAGDRALAANDPLRVGALIRLASAAQAGGHSAAARASFDQSGLAANQCAILDRQPAIVSYGGTFPEEAMEWGFEGWTRIQFDVGADGAVRDARAVMSYPPFIFTKAGSKTIATARYSKTFRPDGGVGCGGMTEKVTFRMP